MVFGLSKPWTPQNRCLFYFFVFDLSPHQNIQTSQFLGHWKKPDVCEVFLRNDGGQSTPNPQGSKSGNPEKTTRSGPGIHACPGGYDRLQEVNWTWFCCKHLPDDLGGTSLPIYPICIYIFIPGALCIHILGDDFGGFYNTTLLCIL